MCRRELEKSLATAVGGSTDAIRRSWHGQAVNGRNAPMFEDARARANLQRPLTRG
jgi:hypothetical protein